MTVYLLGISCYYHDSSAALLKDGIIVAVAVCEDDALEYFDCDIPIPGPTDYMLMVYLIKKEWHDKIPAVTHVDGSGRLQTIRRPKSLILRLDQGIWEIIRSTYSYKHIIQYKGEPIVCTPHDAYKCMMSTGIDFLIIGKFLIKRENNPKDMWDSEKYAKD